MPRLPKPKPLRQNSERRDIGLVSIEGKLAEAPPAPKGLLKSSVDTWVAFWRSPTARLVQADTDLPALIRLWSLYDEHERCYRASREDRLVLGSQGQYVLNPLYRQMVTLETEIRNLEDRFGLSPMARLKLGVTFGDAARSLADINANLEDDDDADGDQTTDLRLSLAGGASAD
jgi:P27 family predicted phage terminase small subunit